MGCTIITFYFVLMEVLINLAAPQVCPPGTFLYTIVHTGQHFCIECQDGTFVPYKDHQQTSCRPCEKIKEPKLEILISPCNKTCDAVIHCVDGYYRDEARNPRETGQCRKCTECSKFTGQPCGTYRDTVCCWDENYDVVPNHHGVPVCRERPWFCRRGQYFDTRGFQCLPCADNTFMPIDYHVQPECWKCREYDKYESYRPLHSVIIEPCNSTHAPVIRCEDGFFMNPKMSYTDEALGCSPCTDCSTTDVQYEGRKCDFMEDTVCCPQPNMTVVDTPDGPVCTASSAGCVGVHCLYHYVRKNSTTCAPCMDITDLDVATTLPVNLRHASSKTQPGFLNVAQVTPVAATHRDSSDHLTTVIRASVSGIVITALLALALFVIYQKLYLKKGINFGSSILLRSCIRKKKDRASIGNNDSEQAPSLNLMLD